jgi:protein tyrosine/serine phosphatase
MVRFKKCGLICKLQYNSSLIEGILTCGQPDMLVALQTMTTHLEQNPGNPIVIHCVQGKDRTGMLAMLCQSMLGLSDEEIVTEYNRSEGQIAGYAAAQLMEPSPGKLDRKAFSGSPRKVMELTLEWIRSSQYDSVTGYLNAIGFDSSWQERFTSAMSKSSKL